MLRPGNHVIVNVKYQKRYNGPAVVIAVEKPVYNYRTKKTNVVCWVYSPRFGIKQFSSDWLRFQRKGNPKTVLRHLCKVWHNGETILVPNSYYFDRFVPCTEFDRFVPYTESALMPS